MKKFSVLFLIIFSCFQSIAQNLSIADMQTIYNLPNWDAVDVYLTKKGWKFEGSEKETYDQYGIIKWVYNKNDYSDKANGWFVLKLQGEKFHQLRYQLADETKYNLEKSSVAHLGYKFVESQIENNELISKYKNSSFYLTLVVNKESDSYSDNAIYRSFYLERIPKEIVDVPVNIPTMPSVSNNQNIVKDVDGNIYKTVKIGDQVWMAENLNVTKYNDGTPIPIVTDPTIWSNMTNSAMCWYDNNKNKYTINKYGALYNFYTVNTGKLCPSAWHIPSNDEWIILSNSLGGETVASVKMKSTTSWEFSGNGTNTSAFSGLAVGFRDFEDGSFLNINIEANWWSTTQNSEEVYIRYLSFDSQKIIISLASKNLGLSVRCIKN